MFDNQNFIFHKSGIYSHEGCNHAINFFEKRVDLQHVGESGGGINLEWKRSTDILLKRCEYTLAEDMLQGCIKDYVRKYPFTNQLKPWDLSPTFRIQRYKPNEGYFLTHCENMCKDDSERVLSWQIFLNDVKDGGHTVFPSQKRKFRPRRGDVLMWPAYFTHPHHGESSRSHTKYIMTGWCSFKS